MAGDDRGLADAGRLGVEVLVMVERYCVLYVRWREAEAQLAAGGIVTEAPRSRVRMLSPWLSVARQASSEFLRLERELGLSPHRRLTARPLLADGSPAPQNVWDDISCR